MMSGQKRPAKHCGRKPRCELLESRQMLSVNTGAELTSTSVPEFTAAVISPAADNSLGARDQSLAISAVHLLIDGREVTLTSLDQPLQMEVGSSLQVVGIDYRLNGEEVVDGKIAFEGYLNKLRGSRTRTDYSDGRFGGHMQEGELPSGSASHPGLNDAWKMEAGTESMTLVMVRYGADEVVVEDRITINTQVGTPDFVINPEIIIKGSNKGVVAGRAVKIYGTWGNLGEGTYRNYAEVDIYHESDPTKIVWSGTLADVVDAGELDKGQFLNKTKRDGFSRSWIPELGGTYTLKFYADPESRWAESNEDNNQVTTKLEVQDLRQVARGRGASGNFGFNHHSVVDTPARDAALAVAANELNVGSASARDVETLVLGKSSEQVDRGNQDTVAENSLASEEPAVVGVADQLAKKNSEDRSETASEDAWLEAIDTSLSKSAI